jgi:hypothetical protein
MSCPSKDSGVEQIEAFRSSVEDHLRVVSGLDRLRDSRRKRHSVFGEFDGHDWHCMFRFHLLIHYKQAAYVVRKACAEQGNKVSSVPIPTHG